MEEGEEEGEEGEEEGGRRGGTPGLEGWGARPWAARGGVCRGEAVDRQYARARGPHPLAPTPTLSLPYGGPDCNNQVPQPPTNRQPPPPPPRLSKVQLSEDTKSFIRDSTANYGKVRVCVGGGGEWRCGGVCGGVCWGICFFVSAYVEAYGEACTEAWGRGSIYKRTRPSKAN